MALKKPRYLLKYEGSYRLARILIESLRQQIDRNLEYFGRREAKTSFCIELSAYQHLTLCIEDEVEVDR